MRKPLTGEPCAGEPHARFGGRGRRKPFPTPIGKGCTDFFQEFRREFALQCESRIWRYRNSAEEKKQFLAFVPVDFLDDFLPSLASLEHNALQGCPIFRLRNRYQNPLIGKLSLDGLDGGSFHKSSADCLETIQDRSPCQNLVAEHRTLAAEHFLVYGNWRQPFASPS